MSELHFYTIGELAELAGVTPRTIRYYTAEGLLPRPDARGQYARYSEEHLLRLQLIGRLKDAYLPLSEIKAQIEHLSGEQIRVLLAEGTQPQPAPPSSAADYLAQLLNRPSGPTTLAEAGAEYRLSLASEAPAPTAPPAAHVPVVPPGAPMPAAAPTMRLSQPQLPAPPAAAPAPVSSGFAAPAEQPAPRTRLLHRLLPALREQPTPELDTPPAEEQWRRIQLAPGIELHLREPLAAALRERAEQLIAMARNLFEDQAG